MGPAPARWRIGARDELREIERPLVRGPTRLVNQLESGTSSIGVHVDRAPFGLSPAPRNEFSTRSYWSLSLSGGPSTRPAFRDRANRIVRVEARRGGAAGRFASHNAARQARAMASRRVELWRKRGCQRHRLRMPC